MGLTYYTYPRLVYYPIDFQKKDFEKFKRLFFENINQKFEVHSIVEEYGVIQYNEPCRDNQFIGGYIRAVYYKIIFSNHHEIVVYFHDEESDTDRFAKAWPCGFSSFEFVFLKGENWSWVLFCKDALEPFIDEVAFRENTFTFIYGNILFQHFKKMNDEGAMAYITKKSEEKVMEHILDKDLNYIQIQHMPYLEIDRLLLQHPHKENIKSIAISECGLRKIPESTFLFLNCTSLRLNNNLIEGVDDAIGALSKLTELNLYNNPIGKNELSKKEALTLIPSRCKTLI